MTAGWQQWPQRIDEVIDEGSLSGVVHVSRGGDVLYERAAGLADRAHDIANTMDTQFAVASGSKGFTALAVISLVADRLLTLDTSARKFLSDDLNEIDTTVTVEHLLAHTSGIGDFLDESAPGDVNDYVLGVPVHELATTDGFRPLLRRRPMAFAPGQRFEYCNGGYVVLALIIEAVTGQSFHDVVTERVIRPAGLSNTGYLRSDALPGSAAIGYLYADGLRTNQLHLPARGSGDGGAYSTAADFAAFWPALLAGSIVPAPLVREMTKAHNDVPAESMRYGLGFWLRADRDTVMLEGYDAGVSFRSAYDPPSRLLYTVMANTSSGAWPVVRLLDEALPALVA